MDGTTVCPNCGARVWVARDVEKRVIMNQQCVCGHIFTPDDEEPFLTGKQKRAMQDSSTTSPSKGPQPVKRKRAAKKTKRGG